MSNTYSARALGPNDQEAWDRVVRSHATTRAIVPKWDELSGWTMRNLGLFRGPTLVGGLSLAVRRIPVTPFSLGRISTVMIGPVHHAEMLETLLTEVERYSTPRLIIETELRLRIPADDELEGFEYHRDLKRVIADFGYRALGRTESTYLVDLEKDDDALLAGFDSKARNSIRKALKTGAVIGTSSERGLIELFYDAYVKMSERKNAPETPKALLVSAIEPLLDHRYAEMFTESYQGVVSNIAVVDVLGVPCYVLGTRTDDNVQGKVPGAAQALQYEIMKRMRDRGKKYYDLGGCEGPVPMPDHPNFGVWRFKHAFNGRFVRFLPFYRKHRGPTRPMLDAVHKMRGDYL